MEDVREVAITYEKLYEILCLERIRDELQDLDSAFFSDLLIYLKEKEKIYTNARNKVDLFAMAERDTVQIQLSNIRWLIKELYERREKKIITMAINKSRTQSSLIDTSNMLEEERLLFKSLVAELDFFRQGILHNLFLLKSPTVLGKKPNHSIALDSSSNNLSAEIFDSPNFSPHDFNPQKTEDASSKIDDSDSSSSQSSSTDNQSKEEQSKTKMVKFTKSMPQLVGEELELYGPFEPEEEAELPSEIAELVISEGSAVEI